MKISFLITFSILSTIWSDLVDGFMKANDNRMHSLLTPKLRTDKLTMLSSTTKPLIVGLNKYSHDASVCIINANDGKILYTQAKERISRRKHDGGAIGELLQTGLQSIDATLDDIELVVSNNHHFRVLPFEKRINTYLSLKYVPLDYGDPANLIPNAKHLELSHHLAHAWSAAGTAPFRKGLIIVMDGMGESYKAMVEDITGIETDSGDYMHDLRLLRGLESSIAEKFVGQPRSLSPGSGYREAESAYVFDGDSLIPVFKRWSRERSPPELYNHGFENMESLGAIYSRISSHVLGDWNACGKIMGLAPWSNKKRKDATDWIFNPQINLEQLNLGDEFHHDQVFMSGNPYIDNSFSIDWKLLDSLKDANTWTDDKKFSMYATMASSIQTNLENSAIALSSSLKSATGETNVALVGGVALNSVLNGKLKKDLGFDNVFIPPGPGDEGIAVGCALYGLQRYRNNQANEEKVPMVHTSFSAYQGKKYSDDDIEDALSEWQPWITTTKHSSEEMLINSAVDNLTQGKVIAWFQGRSEFGQRALGARSILADPRQKEVRRFINEIVKEREWYRPLAPSVLEEYAGQWFDELKDNANESPYMSITAHVKEEKISIVPAICHVDGSARLQTVSKVDEPLYHALIKQFHSKTKVPMILNTSFNRKSQPIVETPREAVKTFLSCKNSINTLFLGNWEISIKPFPLSLNSKNEEEPFEKDGMLGLYARDIYLSEITSSTTNSENPLRIRIQDGDIDDDKESAWRILPDQLHLEILLLLQQQDNDASAGGDVTNESGFYEENEAAGLTVNDLFEAISQVHDSGSDNDEDEDDTKISWNTVFKTLKWLYDENLISIEKMQDENEIIDDDVDFESLFPGTKVVDLRGVEGEL